MRNLKKILALVMALVMSMSLVTIANAADFTDNDDISYEEAVDVMSTIGVIEGFEDGSFDPDGTLTREQAAALVTRMLLGDNADRLGIEESTFDDVAVTRWSAPYIEYCASLGLIDGAGDGNFYPAGQLTGYAFAKILLTALGYSSEKEGLTGTSWSVNTAALAMEVGLHAGLENGISSAVLSREEAAQMALNAIQSPLVSYNNDATVTVNGAEVAIGGGDYYYITTTLAKEQRISDQRLSNTNEYTVEFGERYFPNLRLNRDDDAFSRPSRTWTYENKTIGTYVDYETRIGYYTEAVTGREMYDLLSKSVIDKYKLEVYVDGYLSNGITSKHLVRGNSSNLAYTGKGVLTEVFVDHDDEVITITCINTYLAVAQADYNEKTDKVTFDVYSYNNATSVHALDKAKISSMYVLGEDFDVAKDIKEDDIVLVNVGLNDIQIIRDPQVISEAKLSAFSMGKKVVSSGETYEYANTAKYDVGTLDEYDDQNLADARYNIYLDAYGYLIGIELVTDASTYLFVTGVNITGSNTASAIGKATAIFPDGRMEEISVNLDDSTFASGKDWADDMVDTYSDPDSRALINTWYSYKVNTSNVYTLTYVANQARTIYSGANGTIDRANIGLNGDNGTTSTYGSATTVVYGNANTNYITVGLKKLGGGSNTTAIISKVKSVNTGIKNTDLDVYYKNAAWDTVDDVNAAPTYMSQGVYAMYKDGYVVNAIVVGKDSASTENTFYALSSVNYEEYTDGKYYWSVDGIMNGVETTIREAGDWGDLKVLDGVKKGDLFTVGFNAAGFVVEKSNVPALSVISAGPDEVINETLSAANLHMVGWTLYLTPDNTNGVVVADECPTALVETVDGSTRVTYYSDAATAIKAMQDSGDVNGRLIATLDSKKMATSIIIVDDDAQGFVPPTISKDGTATGTVKMSGSTLKVYVRRGDPANVLAYALTYMENAGYTVDSTLPTGTGEYMLQVGRMWYTTQTVTLDPITIATEYAVGVTPANKTIYLAKGDSATVSLTSGGNWSQTNLDDLRVDVGDIKITGKSGVDTKTVTLTLTSDSDYNTGAKTITISWS